MSIERCETCRFFFEDTWMESIVNECCRRRSPKPKQRVWPEVFRNDWCGEYEPKDRPAASYGVDICAVHFFELDKATERAICKHCGFMVTKQTLVETGYLDYVEHVKKGEGP
jgi:hypothetical protein